MSYKFKDDPFIELELRKKGIAYDPYEKIDYSQIPNIYEEEKKTENVDKITEISTKISPPKSGIIPELSKSISPSRNSQKNNITKTIKPKLADINYTLNIETLKKISNYCDVIKGIEKEIQISLDYYSSLQDNDVVGALKNFYQRLEKDKLPSLSNEFVDFWVKRFSCTAQPLKTILKDSLNIDNLNFFNELSDSIGLLVNSNNLLDDAVIPLTDLTTGLYQEPNYIPVQLRNKISSTTLNVTRDLSSKNTVLMRNNLKTINLISKDVDPYTTSSTLPAHSSNLVTDINLFYIFKNNLNSFYQKLNGNYKKLINYIEFISNIENRNGYNPRDNNYSSGLNQQIAADIVFSMDVEKFRVSLDALQRKVVNILSYKTIQSTLVVKTPQEQQNQAISENQFNNIFRGNNEFFS